MPLDAVVDDLSRPIRTSADGHFLVTPDGSPFFWLADTAWDLFQRLKREEAERYLSDRAAQGFNMIQAVIGGASAHQGPNRYGHTPFIEGDPARPSKRYFAHVDWVVERAHRCGLRMALLPYWAAAFQLQYGDADALLKPLAVTFDAQVAEIYGRWLGERYRDQGISWILGGDANPLWPKFVRFRKDAQGNTALAPEQSDLSARDWRGVCDAMAQGLSAGEGRQPFISYHPNSCTFAGMPQPRTALFFADRHWLTMNMIQSGHYESPPESVHGRRAGFSFGWRGPRNYEPIADEFASEPARPVIDGEPRYEDLGRDNDAENVGQKGYWSGYDARNAAYHAVFAGAAGHTYGNHAIWQFADPQRNLPDQPCRPGLTWREALARPVSSQLRHLKALMLSRPYFDRVPSQDLIVGEPGVGTSHIGATRDRAGLYAMVYVPHGQTVTTQMRLIAGPVNAWWFDPRTGDAMPIGRNLPNRAERSFAPPTQGSESDWVLVLDDARCDFALPGAQR